MTLKSVEYLISNETMANIMPQRGHLGNFQSFLLCRKVSQCGNNLIDRRICFNINLNNYWTFWRNDFQKKKKIEYRKVGLLCHFGCFYSIFQCFYSFVHLLFISVFIYFTMNFNYFTLNYLSIQFRRISCSYYNNCSTFIYLDIIKIKWI